ncbi:helix-turn-helix transcriptional regulator [Lactococcus cremoris]|uniref:helix-turn-helix domain-containing protein n=1 Tax=Lactococcus lactis subsp. cremoris TaxID=1359 RepID=UPI002871A837|nr:helix-turn-helix transcriptional regulator [Lactococcus cremoris]MDR9867994.1 helix-turn-helix transcriptional regulator [Lactococcus cremoris]
MIIGQRIKEYRKIYNLSQDDLSEKLFVSRQTISNWETGKTYPDIQIIISLSLLFNVSLNELIEEDMEEMKMKVKNNKERKYSEFYALVMIISTILAALSTGLVIAFPKYNILIFVPIILFIPGIWSAFLLEKFKKNNDLKTYKEILSFSQNKEMSTLRENRNFTKLYIEKFLIVSCFTVLVAVICGFSILIVKAVVQSF